MRIVKKVTADKYLLYETEEEIKSLILSVYPSEELHLLLPPLFPLFPRNPLFIQRLHYHKDNQIWKFVLEKYYNIWRGVKFWVFENSSCHVLPQLCSCENSHVRKKGGGFLNDDVNTHTHTPFGLVQESFSGSKWRT